MTFCLFPEEGWGEAKISPSEEEQMQNWGALSGRHEKQEVAEGPQGVGPALQTIVPCWFIPAESPPFPPSQGSEEGTATSSQTFQALL